MSGRAFFYTDPVAALWMAKTYRMKLTAGGFCLQPESLDAVGAGARPDRFVVSADCVSVLEPRVGDALSAGGGA